MTWGHSARWRAGDPISKACDKARQTVWCAICDSFQGRGLDPPSALQHDRIRKVMSTDAGSPDGQQLGRY